jgi:hypothetical protein
MATVRDFIYVDVERLRSLYSQVFRGVVDSIVQTQVDEQEASEAQEGGRAFAGATIEERVAEASYRTESRILYDHMYNLLEDRLADTIVDATSLSSGSYSDSLQQAFMVKVAGVAEVADYQRITTIFDEFNHIADALHYMSSFEERQQLEAAKREVWANCKQVKDRERKARMKARMDQIAQEIEEEASFKLDDTFLESMSFITKIFYGDRLEVSVRPPQASDLLFRGVLDPRWLRVAPDFLRALYGGYPAPDWTMVGHLTYFPDNPALELLDGPTVDSEPSLDQESTSEAEPPTMRDAYRDLLGAYRGIERTYTDSERFVEVILWPLAIYREVELPDIDQETDNNESE